MGDSDRLMEGHLHEIYEGVWEAVSMTVCWDCKCHGLAVFLGFNCVEGGPCIQALLL